MKQRQIDCKKCDDAGLTFDITGKPVICDCKSDPVDITLGRYSIASNHPIFGESFKKLTDADTLMFGDEYAYVDKMLSSSGCKWRPVDIRYVFIDVGNVYLHWQPSKHGHVSNLIFRRRIDDR